MSLLEEKESFCNYGKCLLSKIDPDKNLPLQGLFTHIIEKVLQKFISEITNLKEIYNNLKTLHVRDKQISLHFLQQQKIFEIQTINNKGRGLASTSKITEGDIIINEFPLGHSIEYKNHTLYSKIPQTTWLAIHWYLNSTETSKFNEKSFTDISKINFEDDIHISETLDPHFKEQTDKCVEYLFYSIIGFSLIETEDIIKKQNEAIDIIWNLFVKHCQIPTNTFAIHFLSNLSDNENSNIVQLEKHKLGVAIFPLCSLINHSCVPNCHIHFNNDLQISIRASRNIQPGEEITISYGCIASNMKKENRIRLLKNNYFFTCNCEACENENIEKTNFICFHCSSLLIMYDSKKLKCATCNSICSSDEYLKKERQAINLLQLGDSLVSQNRIEQALKSFNSCLSILKDIISNKDKRIGQLNDRIAECFALQNNFQKAAHHCQISVDIVSNIYGENAIETANELVKLVELYFNARYDFIIIFLLSN